MHNYCMHASCTLMECECNLQLHNYNNLCEAFTFIVNNHCKKGSVYRPPIHSHTHGVLTHPVGWVCSTHQQMFCFSLCVKLTSVNE